MPKLEGVKETRRRYPVKIDVSDVKRDYVDLATRIQSAVAAVDALSAYLDGDADCAVHRRAAFDTINLGFIFDDIKAIRRHLEHLTKTEPIEEEGASQ
jgi:hypothetical protein